MRYKSRLKMDFLMLGILGVVAPFASWFAYSRTHLFLTGVLLQSLRNLMD